MDKYLVSLIVSILLIGLLGFITYPQSSAPPLVEAGSQHYSAPEGTVNLIKPNDDGTTSVVNVDSDVRHYNARGYSKEDFQIAVTLLLFSILYIVGGWYLYTLVLVIMRRFLVLKWALLVTFLLLFITLNVVGVIRSIVGLLELPTA